MSEKIDNSIKIDSGVELLKISSTETKTISEPILQQSEQYSSYSPRKEHFKHFVQFYEKDAYLLNSLRNYIQESPAIIVATPQHRVKLLKMMKHKKIVKVSSHSFILLDVEETLGKFMIGNNPNPKLFYKIIGNLIKEAGEGNRPVRVFGEMVAFLWMRGNRTGAIKVEKLWNNLQKKLPFTLFCAYPLHELGGKSFSHQFAKVCMTHSAVLPAESYSELNTNNEQLRAIAHLQQKALTLEEEVEKRKKLVQQKNEFMSIVSHELKTPVTSLKAFGQILQKKLIEEGSPQTIEYISKMNTQINKLTVFIEDLLDVTKIQGGKLKFKKDFYSFDDLVTGIIEDVERIYPTHTINIKGATGQMVYCDADRIGQLITNLITNAIKYSPFAQSIDILLSSNQNEIVFSIRDYGMGISKRDQKHIFERFYRSSKGKQDETIPGVGLGLYISSEIAKRHKGRLWVKSEIGLGSTFFFTLPLVGEN